MADYKDPKHPGRINETDKRSDFERKAPAPVGKVVPNPERDEEDKRHEEEERKIREEQAAKNK